MTKQQALLANADDLSAAVGSVYGEEGAAQFDEVWKSHIGYFVDYVTATAEDNQEGKDQALAELEEYKVEQSKFFDTATVLTTSGSCTRRIGHAR
ncbi:hypothetical protein [Planococcus faecalis]|uniref:hypothetical protein n=1 Tax=Planococcus faecalis TaxID=1598147 RepID=UPI0008D9DEAA|nr:hypothetical protein [Planococcus faecalis]OHX51680.1 hypothetical protein BB777_16050 [Planococcus faecalis]